MGLAATSGAIYLYADHLENKKKEMQKELMKPEDYGTPSIGGPFKLIDQNGKDFDSTVELAGKKALLYFGFTHCPDICPEELDKLGMICDKDPSVVPIFVTCDPRRDTPAILREYLRDFHPRIIGLTIEDGGDTEPLQSMAKAFRVYYRPARTGSDDYLLDHSIFFYFLHDGKFVKVYGKSSSVDEIVGDIANSGK